MASSLPGTGSDTASGSALVSTIPMQGMLSLLVSLTAISSCFVSIMNTMSGRSVIWTIPERFFSNFAILLRRRIPSFLPYWSILPVASKSLSLINSLIVLLMVMKFVRVPPSHRLFT